MADITPMLVIFDAERRRCRRHRCFSASRPDTPRHYFERRLRFHAASIFSRLSPSFRLIISFLSLSFSRQTLPPLALRRHIFRFRHFHYAMH